jgi:hypothetical protein
MSNPTPTVINASRAVRMLKDAVATRSPEYNYKTDEERFPPGMAVNAKSCVYVRGGCADCLVGVALVLEGVSVDVLEQIEHESDVIADTHECRENEDCVGIEHGETNIGSRWFRGRLLALSGFDLTDEAVDVFSAAQVYQDTARTWGEALAAADKTNKQGYP